MDYLYLGNPRLLPLALMVGPLCLTLITFQLFSSVRHSTAFLPIILYGEEISNYCSYAGCYYGLCILHVLLHFLTLHPLYENPVGKLRSLLYSVQIMISSDTVFLDIPWRKEKNPHILNANKSIVADSNTPLGPR